LTNNLTNEHLGRLSFHVCASSSKSFIVQLTVFNEMA